MSQPRPAASASTNVFLVPFLNLGNQEKSQITREKKISHDSQEQKSKQITISDKAFSPRPRANSKT